MRGPPVYGRVKKCEEERAESGNCGHAVGSGHGSRRIQQVHRDGGGTGIIEAIFWFSRLLLANICFCIMALPSAGKGLVLSTKPMVVCMLRRVS